MSMSAILGAVFALRRDSSSEALWEAQAVWDEFVTEAMQEGTGPEENCVITVATVLLDLLRQKQADHERMLRLVGLLAQGDPWRTDQSSSTVCAYCGRHRWADDKDHEADCVWLLAQSFITEGEPPKVTDMIARRVKEPAYLVSILRALVARSPWDDQGDCFWCGVYSGSHLVHNATCPYRKGREALGLNV